MRANISLSDPMERRQIAVRDHVAVLACSGNAWVTWHFARMISMLGAESAVSVTGLCDVSAPAHLLSTRTSTSSKFPLC
jgi:hypothetical protein